ncbi:protein-disulfide isomerase [Homoserinimonas aerilata]|uniref:Protein-disulfide isomerase n=1 Tax=Homoserinimonas aerilata TaxID=1162970 RepID=A0A542YH35_9MICO|nr:thioredoxin domain-containing protein [Homoserinimonas aerilata]TQL47420.1 protein-disulfide isomerase [Homoserinimonas aerilata]
MNTNAKISGIITILALLVIVIIIAAIALTQNTSNDVQNSDEAFPSAIRKDTHRLTTAENEEVVVVEFLDFECESCGAAHPYVEDLRERYGDRVTFALRYFPLPGHFNSKNAAVAAEAAAQQGELEAMYNRLFSTQLEWGEASESHAPLFRTFAEDLGLDMDQYDEAVADPETLERVESDFNDGRQLGVESTPTFFVNDTKVELRSFEDLEAAIRAELQ